MQIKQSSSKSKGDFKGKEEVQGLRNVLLSFVINFAQRRLNGNVFEVIFLEMTVCIHQFFMTLSGLYLLVLRLWKMNDSIFQTQFQG